jgi:hypothetical protein
MLSLDDSERDEFLYLQKQLMLFTNMKFGIYNKFNTIDDLSLTKREEIEKGIMPI